MGVFVGLHVLASPFALLGAYGAASTAAIVLAPVRPLPAGSVTATVLYAGNFVAAVATVAILTAISGPPGRRGLLAGVSIGVQLVGWAVLLAGAPW